MEASNGGDPGKVLSRAKVEIVLGSDLVLRVQNEDLFQLQFLKIFHLRDNGDLTRLAVSL